MKLKKMIANIALVATMAALLGACADPLSGKAKTISMFIIPGVSLPATGAVPSTSFDTYQYSGSVSWSPAASASFSASTIYTATITLTPKSDYSLNGVAANSFTVAEATSVKHEANSGVVTVVFPATASVVSIFAILGVSAPDTGAAPAKFAETEEYIGSVSWSPAATASFSASTIYTATITLRPKSGFSLNGVAANSFTVEGATSVSHEANSGVVTAVFPATMAVISTFAIPGVTVPTAGAVPVTSVDTEQYSGTVNWSPEVNGSFAAYTSYKASLTLTPKPGYTLNGVTANIFTVAGATNVFYQINSGVVSAYFPRTARTINTPAIKGIAIPSPRAVPVTSLDSEQYSGSIAWSPTVSGVFAENTSYTATITLTAKTGYTLSGVTVNSFTVDGAGSVTHEADSGVVSAVFTSSGSWLALVAIAGGTYQSRTSTVTVSSFSVSKHEITQGQYRAVTGYNPSTHTGDNDLPVTNVSWYDAVEFCNKLSEKEGKEAYYTITNTTVSVNEVKNGYRLPTEAQWEYACRGGTTGTYYWGESNDASAYAWYDSNAGGTTHGVGQKTPNSYGLYDMSGNVYEWCWDWDGPYPSGPQTDPTGASSGTNRIHRGGSFQMSSSSLRSDARATIRPDYAIHYIGFRIAAP